MWMRLGPVQIFSEVDGGWRRGMGGMGTGVASGVRQVGGVNALVGVKEKRKRKRRWRWRWR